MRAREIEGIDGFAIVKRGKPSGKLVLPNGRGGEKIGIKPGSDAGGHVIPAALAYIEPHFTEPIKLDDLAAACFVNKYYLSHLFTRTVGCSIGVYITEKRLKQVCALLVQTKLPVVDLGRKCGFNDPAYLGKIFKARFGVTPSRYRRLHTDGGESPESEKPGGARS